SFKSSVTRQARQTAMIDAEQPIWQARYHDHIVRSEDDFHRINRLYCIKPGDMERRQIVFEQRVIVIMMGRRTLPRPHHEP
ncbi:MAG: hypothetical protein SNJ83_13750, partial [Aggregatilineales bacterium]